MNLISLFVHLNLASVLGLAVAVVIPAVSALLVKAHWDSSITGLLTLALSAADGFFTQWVHAGNGFDWKAGLGASLGAWLIAAVSQSKILSGTALEARLLQVGTGGGVSENVDPTVGLDYTDPTPVPDPAPVEPAAQPTPAPQA